MLDAEALRHIERVYRFTYPPAFWQRLAELCDVIESDAFRTNYPTPRLLGTHDAIWDARLAESDLPDSFVPFLVVGSPPGLDYYGFPIATHGKPRDNGPEGPPVLVWSIHAYVHGWDHGFDAFLDDVSSQPR